MTSPSRADSAVEPCAAQKRRLEAFFSPRCIAVIGASADSNKPAGRPLRLLRRDGFAGSLYGVNPRHGVIDGTPCVKDVGDVPEHIDLALVMVGAHEVEKELRKCANLGVRFAIVFASGFAESRNPMGQQKLLEALGGDGLRMLGPNCVGAVHPFSGVTATFNSFITREALVPGSLGVVSQGGALGSAVIEECVGRGLGIRTWISTGNEADLGALDFASYLLEDPDCTAIAIVAEGFKDGRRLLSLGKEAKRRGKLLAVLKTSLTQEGRRAALLHTGKLGGSAKVWRSVAKEAGIVEARSPEELADVCVCFEATREWQPSGGGVAVLTASGGLGAFAVDVCGSIGLPVPALSASTRSNLQRKLPPQQSVENPVDTGYFAKDNAFISCAEVVLSDPSVDIALLLVDPSNHDYATVTPTLSALAHTSRPKGLALSYTFSGKPLSPRQAQELTMAGVFIGATVARTVVALGAVLSVRGAETGSRVVKVEEPLSEAKPGFTQVGVSYEDLVEIAKGYNLPFPRQALGTTAAAALRAAREIGFPVVAKVVAPALLHKTEVDAVTLDIRSERQLVAALRRMRTSVETFSPDVAIAGFLVQEFVQGGSEMLLGSFLDAEFGKCILVGWGGFGAELYDDASVRPAPVSKLEALEMVEHLRMSALLHGYRDRPQLDISALLETICNFSQMVNDQSSWIEAEINPLQVLEEGRGTRVLDLTVVGQPPARPSRP